MEINKKRMNEVLAQRSKNLESERVEAEYKIEHLREQLQDHGKMLSVYDLANEQLARERLIAQTAIGGKKERKKVCVVAGDLKMKHKE
jgi:hypothetical protein